MEWYIAHCLFAFYFFSQNIRRGTLVKIGLMVIYMRRKVTSTTACLKHPCQGRGQYVTTQVFGERLKD